MPKNLAVTLSAGGEVGCGKVVERNLLVVPVDHVSVSSAK